MLFAINPPLEKVSLQLQWKHQFQFAGYYIAKEKGFYKDVDLEVEIKEFVDGINPVDDVVNNKATYATGRSSLIMHKANGKPIHALAAIFQSSPLVLMVSPKSNIKTMQDLKGKTIMLSPDESTTVSINAMLTSQKLSLDDMKRIKHTFKTEDLINGITDVSSAYLSTQPYKFKKAGIKPIIFDPKDYGFDFYNDILFTSSDEIQNHLKRAKNFRDASLKGWKYAFDNIEETIDLIIEKYNTQNKTKDELLYEAKISKQMAFYKVNEIGKIDKKKVEKVYDIYNVMGYIKNKIDFDEFIIQNKITNQSNKSLTQKQKEYLEDKEQITMCIDPNWMPYEKFDEYGNHIGLSSEYFDIFQKKLNIPIRVIKTKNWSESLAFSKKRKCDILSLAMETPLRKKYLNFTTPYLTVPLVMATKNNISFIDSFKQLNDKSVGLIEDYAFIEILKEKYPNLNIVEVKNTTDGLQQVVDDKLFGFIGSSADIGYIFQKEFTGELKIAGKFDEKWELGIGVRNDDILLLNIFQKLVESISNSEHQSIFNKYVAIKYEKGVDYTLLLQISILFLIILVVVIFFSMRQNRLKNQLNTLFEQSLNPILLLDIDTQKFIKFNKEALRMYGYTQEEFKDITTLDLSAEFTSIELMKQKQQEILKKGFDEFTSKHKTSDGKIIDVFMKTQVLNTNNKKIFYVTVDDISKQIENEKAILSYQKDLESKVKDEVEKNRQKDKTIHRQTKLAAMGEMIGNIAHQWRQPLNRINLSLAVIDDVIKEYDLDKRIIEDKVKTAQKNLLYMSDTIEDFANFFRPDKRMELFCINKVINKAIKLVGNRKDTVELKISNFSNIYIDGYESELLQVLLIILNNALDNFIIQKTQKPRINIELKENKNNIEIVIADNGGGIDQENIDKIFDPYFTTKFKNEGTGIGLYMAKMIIEDSMNGILCVTSDNKSTAFTIELRKLKEYSNG
jgi:polar amino acid transport system substrate-binding protein